MADKKKAGRSLAQRMRDRTKDIDDAVDRASDGKAPKKARITKTTKVAKKKK